MKVRTLIRRDGDLWHFFEVTWEGGTVELCEGPVGHDGNVAHHDFPSTEEADEFVSQIIAERIEQGYAEHEGELPTTASDARNRDLEADILAHPEDVSRYLVYADWLQAHGNPHGDLIAIQAQMEEDGRTDKLVAGERALLDHHPGLLGDVGRFPHSIELRMRLGYIQAATVSISPEGDAAFVDPAALVESVIEHPLSMLLEELNVGRLRDYDADYTPILDELERLGPLTRIARLSLGTDELDSGHRLEAAARIRVVFPNLRELELNAGGRAHLALPVTIESLRLGASGVWMDTLEELLAMALPELRGLHVRGRSWNVHDVNLEALLSGTSFPRLKSLSIQRCGFSDELFARLARSELLVQLDALDLTGCPIRADWIVPRAVAFAHLKVLRLELDAVRDADALRRVLPQVDLVPSGMYVDGYYDEHGNHRAYYEEVEE